MGNLLCVPCNTRFVAHAASAQSLVEPGRVKIDSLNPDFFIFYRHRQHPLSVITVSKILLNFLIERLLTMSCRPSATYDIRL